jgi:putative transcriptional regulator
MAAMTLDKIRSGRKRRGYLEGHMLVAMPGMTDPRFARAVIYLCAHSKDGAMGLVVNQRARRIKFPDLLVQLEVIDEHEAIRLPKRAGGMQVLKGGPVETQRGFVLHSSDYHADDTTMPIDRDVSLTATLDILRAIASDSGPYQAILALGYAGWSPGQLEEEIQQNGWLSCEADNDLLFGEDLESKYARALRKIGIDPAMLVSSAGHA